MKYLFFVLATLITFFSAFFLLRNNSGTKASSNIFLTRNTSEILYTPRLPSLDQIFTNDHTFTATLSAEKKITIIATGDIIPARSVNLQILSRNDFLWPYRKTFDVIKNADITFGNLETPLLTNCPPTQNGMVFCGDARNVAGLRYAGIDIVNLGNNHAGNHGIQGVEETIAHLKENGIGVTGVEGAYVMKVKGIRFAFLGYDDITTPQPGVSNVDENKIMQDIANARQLADVVIVQFHWGVEYRALPDERQIELGHFAIDHGADLVIGNHPHWIQPIEIYKGKLITYAHGNYIFDQIWSKETTEGVIGRYTFYGKQLIDVEYLPIKIIDYGQAYFLEGTEKQEIIDMMRNNSYELEKQLSTNHT